MEIKNSSIRDIDEIFRLYRLASQYQKITFPENQWPEFDRRMVEKEINENRQFKLVVNDQIACVWAITFSDPEIWEEKNKDPAIYIHRIATNPAFRGNNFVSNLATWAREYAKAQDKEYVRLDTCGNNEKLIKHYKRSGFEFLGMQKLKNSTGLPAHYVNADVCYFEMKL